MRYAAIAIAVLLLAGCGGLPATTSRVDYLERRVSRIDRQVDQLEDRINALEDIERELNDLEDRIDDLEGASPPRLSEEAQVRLDPELQARLDADARLWKEIIDDLYGD